MRLHETCAMIAHINSKSIIGLKGVIMNTIDTIMSRKSIRSYTGESISDEELNTIIEAGEAAPVGMGRFGSCHITIIKNKELISEIDSAAAKMFGNPASHPLYGAPIFVVVSANIPPQSENSMHSSAAMIVHNMALMATDMGIGSCDIWGAVRAMNADSALVKKLNLPEGFVPCCGIILGKTTETFTKRDIDFNRMGKNII